MIYSYHNRSACIFCTRWEILLSTDISQQGDVVMSRPLLTSFVCMRRNILASAKPRNPHGPIKIGSYHGVLAWKATHSKHYNHTPELRRSRGQHRFNTRLGGWTQINIKERNRVLLRASYVVGDVPNSGYMLRFTQEHACLRISTKPVDMPEIRLYYHCRR